VTSAYHGPMSDAPVHLTPSGPPETVLTPEAPEVLAALAEALAEDDPAVRRDRVAAIVAANPRFLDGWAQLGRLGRDDVGYHRGLDRLRASGWRGSGYVRWEHESNRGFLRALDGLRRSAAAIGEADEEERCGHFLAQCDPHLPTELS